MTATATRRPNAAHDPSGTRCAHFRYQRAMKLETLKALALPYAYHPDFRPEWAPAWWRDEHATKTEAPQ